MDWKAVLDARPSEQQVRDILEALEAENLNEPTPRLLSVFSTLVNQTVFDLQSLNYVPVFQSITGLGCIISQLAILLNNEPQSPRIPVLVSLLESVLNRQTLIRDLRTVKPNETQAIFVGSRLFATTSMIKSDTWIADGSQYTVWVVAQLAKFDPPALLIDKTFKLGYAKDAFLAFLSNPEKFKAVLDDMRPSQQQYAFVHGGFPSLEKLSVESTAAILKYLDPKIDLIALAEQFPLGIQLASVCITKDFVSATTKLLSMWGDRAAIQTVSMVYQTAQTQMLVSLACHMSAADAKKVIGSLEFISAISHRLESLSERARLMGTLVADMLSQKAGDKLKFAMESGEWNFQVYTPRPLTEALAELDAPKHPELELTPAPIVPDKGSDDEGEAVGDSDDEDDEKIVAQPVYIKTLLEYLSSDSYEQIQSGLQYGSQLIYRKADFGSEVHQYAPELLVLLAGLGDKFNIRNFSELRQQIMTAILVADYTQGELIAKLALTGDLSLFQRMSLMSTMVLAAKELSNYVEPEMAPSKLLPEAQHKVFAKDIDSLVYSLQDRLVLDTKAKVTEDLGGPQVLRVSKKLQLQKASTQGTNKFAKVAARYFFFPLAVHRPRRAGDYTPMILGHLIKTLGLLIYYAYPSNDMPDMVSELLDMLVSLSGTEPVLIEAAYTALLVLCDVAGGILVSRYPQKLAALYDWARQSWQDVPDDRIQKLGAGVVLRLGDLVEQISKMLEA